MHLISCRYLADAAPQKGEASMRSGAQAPDDDSTRQFKAQSQRLMGDMNDAGDAPFGGEMQVDSQVWLQLSICSTLLNGMLMTWGCNQGIAFRWHGLVITSIDTTDFIALHAVACALRRETVFLA